MQFMFVTFDTFHSEMSPLNDEADMNMPAMLVTLDTSHLDRSPLNLYASSNNPLISATPETSQDPIGPCGPLEQSKSPRFRHCAMASLSSALDLGAQAVAVV